MTSGNADVVRALYAAFSSGDAPGIFATLDPEVVWEVHAPKEHPYGGTFSGFDGTRTFLGAIGATVEMQDFGADEVVASGDVVVAMGHERFRVRRTGKTLSHRWLHVFRLRGGKVVRFDEWFDSAAVMEVLR
jgi:uncharacterized protein